MSRQHWAVTAERLWDGSRMISGPIVEIIDGQIASLASRDERELPANAERLDFPGATLAPAFFDVHIHGAAGHDVMEGTTEAIAAVSNFLAAHGTGSFLATTVTAPIEPTLRSLSCIASQIDLARQGDWSGASPLGIHLEGPFLSHAKRGVHPPEHLLAPDIALFDRLYEAAQGHVRLITLAPELPGAIELAAHATSRGVRVSVGHSNATMAETQAAIAAGARSATHTFNAMRPLDHREPGILGAALTTDSLYAELICDGVHVHPSLVNLWWRAKGSQRGILVTDAMSATGMPDGDYTLGEFAVQVADGRATANGVLAGSVLTLDRALTNFVEFTGSPLEDALPLLSRNPAAMTGFEANAGSICAGQEATFVALDRTGGLAGSVVRGKRQPAS